MPHEPIECPSEAVLTAYNLGKLDDAMFDTVAIHLDDCSRCDEVMRTLDSVSDPLIHSLRKPRAVDQPPEEVGEYVILQEIARGGMGIVYRARHKSLGRIVAIKMLLQGRFSDPRLIERFESEAAVISKLQHPNIVSLYDFGQYDSGTGASHPYFVLEFVDGGDLEGVLNKEPLNPTIAARWLAELTDAIQSAHELGVVHRDVKPSNVLMQGETPKLCDFGIAKLDDGSAIQTETGLVVGTLEYMSPEQVDASNKVTHLADVYSLGSLLYCMLTGRPPFRNASRVDTIQQLKNESPVPVRRLSPRTPVDLETICHKCLEKQPTKRYQSAEELAEDLERFLHGKPIAARPVGRIERAIKWVRRHPTTALLIAMVACSLVAGTTTASFFALRAMDRESQAQVARKAADEATEVAITAQQKAELQAAELKLAAGRRQAEEGLVDVGLTFMLQALRMCPQEESSFEKVIRQNIANWQPYLPRRTKVFEGHSAPHFVSPNGTEFVSFKENSIFRWHGRTLELLGRFEITKEDGRVTYLVSNDGRSIIRWNKGSNYRYWDVATGTELKKEPQPLSNGVPDNPGTQVKFAAGVLRFVDDEGEQIRPPWHLKKVSLGGRLTSQGQGLVVGNLDSRIRLFDTASRSMMAAALPAGANSGTSYDVSKSGDQFLIVGGGGVNVWSFGKPLPTLHPFEKSTQPSVRFENAAFSPDRTRLIFGSARLDSNRLKSTKQLEFAEIIDTKTGLSIGQPLEGATSSPYRVTYGQKPHVEDGITFNSSGKLVACCSWQRGLNPFVRVWHTDTGAPASPVLHPMQYVHSLLFTHDSKRLIVGGINAVMIWDVETGERVHAFPIAGPTARLHLSASGQYLVGCTRKGWGNPLGYQIWDLNSLQEIGPFVELQETPLLRFEGANLATISTREGRITRRDVQANELSSVVIDGLKGAFVRKVDAKGELLATGNLNGVVRLWDIKTGRPVGPRLVHKQPVTGLEFDSASSMLAVANSDSSVRVWELTTFHEVGPPVGHATALLRIAFTRDSRTLLTATAAGITKRWQIRKPTDWSPERLEGWLAAYAGVDPFEAGQRLTLEEWKGYREKSADLPFRYDPVEWHHALAERAFETGYGNGEAWHLKRILIKGDSHWLTRAKLADVFVRQGDLKRARQHYQVAETLASNEELVVARYRQQSRRCLLNLNNEGAIWYLNQLIRLKPKDSWAYLERSRVHGFLDKNAARLADLEKAVELYPSPDSSKELALEYAASEQWEECARVYSEATIQQPALGDYYRSSIASLLANDQKAYARLVREMLLWLNRHPFKRGAATTNLIVRTLTLGDVDLTEQASHVEHLTKSLKSLEGEALPRREQMEPMLRYSLGRAYYRMGNYPAAVKQAIQAREATREGVPTIQMLLLLAQSYAQMGDAEKARTFLSRAKKMPLGSEASWSTFENRLLLQEVQDLVD